MRYYLSSYKIGAEKEVEKLKGLIPQNKKTAFIVNALDFATDLVRREQSEQEDMEELISVGLEVTRFDLREYFEKQASLENELKKYGVIWVRGGNVFVLRQAMKLSGLDNVLIKYAEKDLDILYGGYSAGVCILSPSLKGLELVDDINMKPYQQQQETIWEGLNIIDYAVVPHYQSDHPESELVNKVFELYKKDGTPFKTLRDGEVIIID